MKKRFSIKIFPLMAHQGPIKEGSVKNISRNNECCEMLQFLNRFECFELHFFPMLYIYSNTYATKKNNIYLKNFSNIFQNTPEEHFMFVLVIHLAKTAILLKFCCSLSSIVAALKHEVISWKSVSHYDGNDFPPLAPS